MLTHEHEEISLLGFSVIPLIYRPDQISFFIKNFTDQSHIDRLRHHMFLVIGGDRPNKNHIAWMYSSSQWNHFFISRI